MKNWIAALIFAALTLAPLAAQAPAASGPAALEVSVGRWVFHGQQLRSRSGKPTPWTWNEDCRWSPNHLFLQCTFSNDWNGRKVESLVVDAYNSADHTYWHYELYAGGENGAHPFISTMAIHGNTWVEQGLPSATGQPARSRVVYTWTAPGHVKVVIESTRDGKTWTTVDQGEGTRLP